MQRWFSPICYLEHKDGSALSFSSRLDTNRTEIHFTEGKKLFRVVEKYRRGTYRIYIWSRVEKNRLIKMLIARLVRRPPAMFARSSAEVALRGVSEYFAFKLSSFFSHFSLFFFLFPFFLSFSFCPIIYHSIAHICTCVEFRLCSLVPARASS